MAKSTPHPPPQHPSSVEPSDHKSTFANKRKRAVDDEAPTAVAQGSKKNSSTWSFISIKGRQRRGSAGCKANQIFVLALLPRRQIHKPVEKDENFEPSREAREADNHPAKATNRFRKRLWRRTKEKKAELSFEYLRT
ncbi:hypothetical protein Pst134EA_031945 [Puccinia striiformis f. sp. tritici]|uniref:uncharacterized protein n=1 Tax=Puccinia striiformis f. sp. tritici TaxID=168172 RepID=UPI0020074FFA|nr:uncharacterized protein Pst134EA_031945 [Puccinia striiformis f. sp. tritici]KAH9444403.1 hypothetical protein Pst134EA_031945 [Puccinia striiformis f. sp. tritici]